MFKKWPSETLTAYRKLAQCIFTTIKDCEAQTLIKKYLFENHKRLENTKYFWSTCQSLSAEPRPSKTFHH